jgi:hypothetical protein
MDDELTPEQQFAAESAHSMVPRALMAGRHPEDVVDDLVRLDWSRARARALVDQAIDDLRRFHASPEARQELLGAVRRQFFVGLGILAIGAGLSVLSILAAALGLAPVALVFHGLFVVGLAMTVVSAGRWRYYRDAAAAAPIQPDPRPNAEPDDRITRLP